MASDESSMVEPEDACPVCSERDADELVWLDDERVQCQSCGKEYRPPASGA